MYYKIILIFILISNALCEPSKSLPVKIVKTTTTTTVAPEIVTETKQDTAKRMPTIVLPKKNAEKPMIIPLDKVQSWAKDISDKFYEIEKQVVRREILLKEFSDVKIEVRNGAAILEKMASTLDDLLQKRARAVENIARRTESIIPNSEPLPDGYRFVTSHHLDELKKDDIPDDSHMNLTLPMDCADLGRHDVEYRTHFGEDIPVDFSISSVQVAGEVFACDPFVLEHIGWSEGLLSTFRKNYMEDVSIDFQYFCSAKGFLRHYPAAVWSSMFKLRVNEEEDEEGVADVYDCRLRPWYVAATGAPRDVLILLDGSGSMLNSSNQINAEFFTLALLNALTDDDQVNIIKFSTEAKSLIQCFEDKLVPANHVNTASMISVMREKKADVHNSTDLANVLEEAVNMLRRQEEMKNRPPSCQQAIVLITDSIELNHTQHMMRLDPSGKIRVFVIWLHDPHGLRDSTRAHAGSLGCTRDGYYAEMEKDASDVTEQVMQILRVMERPLVQQRKNRLRIFSDVYAHIEDPRRSDFFWKMKENQEQKWRYQKLRRNKKALLSPETRYRDFQYQESMYNLGHYYEGQDVDYRYMISVSIPVFDSTTEENITITLDEEKARNSTRTYPVNRLLGVAGVDIPVHRLKILFPYYQLGAGGSLFLVDHKGNIVLHDNLKPTFDGDVLKPGYRTVDFLDVEQPAQDHQPRDYPLEWLEFRKSLVLEEPKGIRTLMAKYIYEDGMRASLEEREYRWKRVMDHYTAVVALPTRYNRRHAVPDGSFTQQLANKSIDAINSEFSVHPDWLYCRHVDPNFDEPEFEVSHFIKRRLNEPNFQMKNLKHSFSPIKLVSLFEKPYQCNEELIARLCKELIMTSAWAKEDPGEREFSADLGSVTAFFASESGLTRWQQYRTTTEFAMPPSGSVWPRGPNEVWYKRAVSSPDTMVIHAAVAPFRKMRRSFDSAPNLGPRYEWLTAARTMGYGDKGLIGVAGYHFFPKNLNKLLDSITNVLVDCDIEDELCPRCDGRSWSCVLVDDAGWLVAGHQTDNVTDDPAREHLSRTHPQVMSALLTAGVFKLHWVHDYQAVCFTYSEVHTSDAGPRLTSILKTLIQSVYALFRITHEVITILTVINAGGYVIADTEKELEKRRKKMKRDMEREKYENLYDEGVFVNRTEFATCDRSRAVYEFQKSQAKVLNRQFQKCKWPFVGSVVPHTNLLLLAVYNLCTYDGIPIPDPLTNTVVDMTNQGAWSSELPATQLACWRNRVPLLGRPPSTRCYPHQYPQEEGYRQCGPWLPDPEPADGATHHTITLTLLFTTFLVILGNL